MSPQRRETRELLMSGHDFSRLIAARHDHERNIGKRLRTCRRRGRLFEPGEMTRHRVETFRLTPNRLNDGMSFLGQLAHLAHEVFESASGSRSEHFHEPARNAWGAAGQKRKTRAHDAE